MNIFECYTIVRNRTREIVIMKNKTTRSPGRPPASASDIPKDQLILKTSTRLFIEQGYQKVSVDDISNACGVTNATVYYYFAGNVQFS